MRGQNFANGLIEWIPVLTVVSTKPSRAVAAELGAKTIES